MTAVQTIRVLSVDRSALVRAGVKAFLATARPPLRIEIVGEASSAAEAVAQARVMRPHVVLLGLRLPDSSGIDACRRIRREHPEARVIILTGEADAAPVQDAVQAGAQGYLLKEIDAPTLVQAVADVAGGKAVLAPEVAGQVLDALQRRADPGTSSLTTLSVQEHRVLALITDGLTNRQIAERLGLTENTVKNYLTNVFDKLQVRRRAQAAALFARERLNGGRAAG